MGRVFSRSEALIHPSKNFACKCCKNTHLPSNAQEILSDSESLLVFLARGRVDVRRRAEDQQVDIRDSIFEVGQAADESPATTKFAHCKHQFIPALFQWKVNGVVVWTHDAEKPGVAESLGASSTKQNFAV